MNKFNKFAVIILLLCGIFSFASITQATDIVPGSALEKEMKEMVQQGILSGYKDGTYKPTASVTREQFAAFINRALNLPAGTHPFKDVPKNSSLSNEIGAAYSAGLMVGVSESMFRPTANITREQMAQTLKNVIEYQEMDLKEKRIEFSDAADFNSSGGIRAVFAIVHYEITEGIPDGKNGLKFGPKDIASREQAAAFIYRFLLAHEKASAPPILPDVPNDNSLYYLGYVDNGQLVKQQYGHKEYQQAAESFKSVATAKVIFKGDEIIRIKSGLAFGDRVSGSGAKEVTTIYFDSNFTKQATYVEHGREILYIDANAEFVKVQVGGTIGYAKHSEVDFVPSELISNRDYYLKNKWSTLEHYQYNYVSKSGSSHSIGPAPAEMAEGVKYYSKDGVHFANEAGATQFVHYPYFQYQSVRTKTNYTAEELDQFLMNRLTAVSSSSGTYKDATTKSKLIGKGKYFIEIQNKYNVNALFILAAAMHESAYGMSTNAQTKNNLFGIRVYDGSPHEGTTYSNPEASIDAFAREYMNRNYANPLGGYANGASPGNKTTGFNVSYASDPTWGAKVAGHMFRTDLELGKKDIGQHQLGITNTASTNVRNAPNGSTILYQFKRADLGVNNAFGYPVVILGEQKANDGYIWYKVISDLNPEADTNNGIGWIRSDLVDLIK
ncbi:S-layer homology domain-containing protein [Planococcus halocryophilus]|uniref:S-layer homology domain-containing protein n=1 Tax=Planococcus halocryophilus TaxID=1215089 RepID=UPI001F10A873|nr:S-layer homology domain-containing protein [Planococcus halocryophilus]MCH4826833.1 S-layer homology domain-containing protein [Planococcus halocryophilus]